MMTEVVGKFFRKRFGALHLKKTLIHVAYYTQKAIRRFAPENKMIVHVQASASAIEFGLHINQP
jgi:hypothetical protein